MCYKVKATASVEELRKRYNAELEQKFDEMRPYQGVSGFAHPKLPVITSEENGKIQLMDWGLVPAWVKDEKTAAEMQNATLNARSETLFEKPSFRSIMKKRCLILVNGFYEWHHALKEKIPYYIHLKSSALFALGGLYDEWVNTNTGEIYKGFSIITVPANPLMAHIHNTKKRMPLILPSSTEKEWIAADINEQAVKSMISPYTEDDMEAEKIKEQNNSLSLWE
ncbi:MAG TPA: SOS response-associated peptidase [Bacteroidia bacterium]|jgi:putative SOS response-associated peptidase YedK|nr:SOS response-associated peptidase [Bacteroidia bacterium]